MNEYAQFLSPIAIGSKMAANRLVAHPVESNTALENGAPSPATFERYRTLASGGWDRRFFLWDLPSRTPQQQAQPRPRFQGKHPQLVWIPGFPSSH